MPSPEPCHPLNPMTSTTSATRQARCTATLLELAQLAHAQWFFGNVYEAVVRVPERLADSVRDGIDQRPTSLLGAGSPVRYYVPAAPVAVASTLGAVIAARGNARGRRWLAISSGCWRSGAAITAYLVRKVNITLFFAADRATPPPPTDRDALLRTWYRLNGLRIAAAAGALFATYRAKRATLEILNT
jgi:hypothetical protein